MDRHCGCLHSHVLYNPLPLRVGRTSHCFPLLEDGKDDGRLLAWLQYDFILIPPPLHTRDSHSPCWLWKNKLLCSERAYGRVTWQGMQMTSSNTEWPAQEGQKDLQPPINHRWILSTTWGRLEVHQTTIETITLVSTRIAVWRDLK